MYIRALILAAISFLCFPVHATETRTYIVNLSSVTDTSSFSATGATGKVQPLFNTKLVPIPGSQKCRIYEVTYQDDSDKSFLDINEKAGLLTLMNVSFTNTYPDPRSGDLITDRQIKSIQGIPSYCYDIAISSGGAK